MANHSMSAVFRVRIFGIFNDDGTSAPNLINRCQEGNSLENFTDLHIVFSVQKGVFYVQAISHAIPHGVTA